MTAMRKRAALLSSAWSAQSGKAICSRKSKFCQCHVSIGFSRERFCSGTVPLQNNPENCKTPQKRRCILYWHFPSEHMFSSNISPHFESDLAPCAAGMALAQAAHVTQMSTTHDKGGKRKHTPNHSRETAGSFAHRIKDTDRSCSPTARRNLSSRSQNKEVRVSCCVQETLLWFPPFRVAQPLSP